MAGTGFVEAGGADVAGGVVLFVTGAFAVVALVAAGLIVVAFVRGFVGAEALAALAAADLELALVEADFGATTLVAAALGVLRVAVGLDAAVLDA